jgi:hypothetical protein
MDPLDLHVSVVTLADPPMSGGDRIAILLDRSGRLIGLWCNPPAGRDTIRPPATPVSWAWPSPPPASTRHG